VTVPRKKKTTLAATDDYAERPYDEAKADPEAIEATENRQPDQISDYHQTHPTLSFSPEQDAVEAVAE
jgi:hypothetical protein